ncbi:hypothetical protein DSO57_1027961 [Entomophthora muscae]|uniref:Uncharacterized protein n=1 Tax=Entomophthora muscae TaxID=34485 RepID=A0ACC2TCL2_9FUNG|nr:hypothetical protein DSO57_1027961 [Entomophthora muscae]
MLCPNQEEQEPASLPSVETGSLISTLKTQESNPNPPKGNHVTQDGQGPINFLSCKPKLLNYYEICQTLENGSLNGHHIAVNPVPPKTQTYTEVLTFLKEVTTRPPASLTNDHQLMPVSSPEQDLLPSKPEAKVHCGDPHVCGLQARVNLASNKDNMLKNDNVWSDSNVAWLVGNKGLPEAVVASTQQKMLAALGYSTSPSRMETEIASRKLCLSGGESKFEPLAGNAGCQGGEEL